MCNTHQQLSAWAASPAMGVKSPKKIPAALCFPLCFSPS